MSAGQLHPAGVLGQPVAHSPSPAMHNAAYEAPGLTGWRYVALTRSAELFEETVRALPGSGYVGANVTIPHKLLVADAARDAARWAAPVAHAMSRAVRR